MPRMCARLEALGQQQVPGPHTIAASKKLQALPSPAQLNPAVRSLSNIRCTQLIQPSPHLVLRHEAQEGSTVASSRPLHQP